MSGPDKHPNEEFLWLGVRWTPGGLKAVLWAVVALAGGGVVKFWDQIATALSVAPVVAFIGVFAVSYILAIPPALAAAGPPDDMTVTALWQSACYNKRAFAR